MRVYTTKAKLWYELETGYFGLIFAFVSTQCDPVDNDPTSNPTIICHELQRLSLGWGSEFYVNKWEQQKRRFKQIAEIRLAHKPNELRELNRRISEATITDAAPLLLVIELDESRLKASPDAKKEGFPENEEYTADDVSPAEVVQMFTDCDCATLD